MKQGPCIDIVALRHVTGGDIRRLPDLFVHDDWTAAPMTDSRARLHLSWPQLMLLRDALPVKMVGQVGPSTYRFLFDIDPHHLLADARDRDPSDKARDALRQALVAR
jgi:hypothetical protein